MQVVVAQVVELLFRQQIVSRCDARPSDERPRRRIQADKPRFAHVQLVRRVKEQAQVAKIDQFRRVAADRRRSLSDFSVENLTPIAQAI